MDGKRTRNQGVLHSIRDASEKNITIEEFNTDTDTIKTDK